MKELKEEHLKSLLTDIRKRPGLYIGGPSLIKLNAFLDGFYYAAWIANEKGNEKQFDFFRGFQEWIQMRYDITSTHHWSSIIKFYSSNDEAAFKTFYELLDEFLNLDDKAREYSYILNKYEKWLKLKEDYWDKCSALLDED